MGKKILKSKKDKYFEEFSIGVDTIRVIKMEKDREINQLKQQLEEKEKKIANLIKAKNHYSDFWINEMKNLSEQIKRKNELYNELNNKALELKLQVATLNMKVKEKDKELLEFKKDKLYLELLFTRLQWLHKRADEYKEEKERFGIVDMSLSSVWDVFTLQKNNLCEYEEMTALQEGIECISDSKLLRDIEHDLQIKLTRKEDDIFNDIKEVEQKLKDLKGAGND